MLCFVLSTDSTDQSKVEDFSAVWSAILNNDIIENSKNPRLWSLPLDTKWLGGIKALFNRPCYEEIITEIFDLSLTHVLIIGTPGIGKTLFLQIVLVHLARIAKKKGCFPPTIYYMFYDVGGKLIKLSLLADGSVVDISDVGQVPDPDYMLSDSVDLVKTSGKVLNLEVASDQKANYNNFAKRVREAQSLGMTMVLPLFSFEELKCIQPSTMHDVTAEFRYGVYGGSARNFLAIQVEKVDVLPVVNETLSTLFSDVKATQYDAWFSVATEVSAQLLAGKDSKEISQTVNSMMWHMLPRRSKTFASKFMEWLAAAIIDERTADIVRELKQIIGESGYGNLFEALGHRKLLKSSEPFLLKPLSASKPVSTPKPKFGSATFNLPVVRFKTVNDIKRLQNGQYGLPMDSNFPVLDAIIQPDTLLQFTISPKKHSGSLEQLPTIRAQLRQKDLIKHRIIFVVTVDNVQTFQYDADLDIRQFICIAEPSVMDEKLLMNAAEKAAWVASDEK